MANIKLIVLVLLLSACGRSAPEHFSIDEAFSEGERQTILAAADAWCDAVGWCPTEARYVERGNIGLVDALPRESHDDPCDTCVISGRNNGDRILIARNRPAPEDLGNLWTIVAHELGHFCTDHTEMGLMAAIQDVGKRAEIDAESRQAWLDGCR